ncbi:MAG: hypothetical protein M3237_18535 [Actinomycetota bacterium]|nr:hypothetical protein [Actinomycetota bacterium]
MAEEIRRRIVALRVAAALAIAMTLAGFAARDTGQQSPPADGHTLRLSGQEIDYYLKISEAAATYYKLEQAGDILYKTAAAENYLKLSDAALQYFKLQDAVDLLHKVEAEATYLKLDDAAASYFKLDDAAGLLYKTEADTTYLKLDDAAKTYLKLSDASDLLSKVEADATYLKITDARDEFVEGDGSVLTGVVSLTSEPKTLLVLPEIGTVLVRHDVISEQSTHVVGLENSSGQDILVTMSGKAQTVPAGEARQFQIDPNEPSTMALLLPAVQRVATVTVTVSDTGKSSVVTGQAIVGAP